MAICHVGRVGLVAFAALYRIASWSQETSRAIAGGVRTALPLPSESNGLKFEHGKFLNSVCVV